MMAKDMTWISVKDRLPYQEPEHLLTYDWVLVTSMRKPNVITIARYLKTGWQFLYSSENHIENVSEGPCCGDVTAYLDIEDITHWMPLPKPPMDENEKN